MKSRYAIAGVTVCLSIVVLAIIAHARDEYPKLSPFDAVEWRKSSPIVAVDGARYELLAIDDIHCDKIVKFCQSQWPGRWQKRFEEDLVEVLTRMDHRPDVRVDLRLKRLDTAEVVELAKVEMTADKRRALWRARSELKNERANRWRDPQYWSRPLTNIQVAEDLEQLQIALESRYSYLKLRGFEYRDALTQLRDQCGSQISRGDLAIELVKLLAGFGDGHTRVRGRYQFLPPGFANFVIADLDGRLVALRPDRSALLSEPTPYLRRVDGLDAERWITAAGALVANGSPQCQRARAIGFAHWTRFIRLELGREATDTITIELENAEADKTSELVVNIVGQLPEIRPRPAEQSHTRLNGNIGYLPISEMHGEEAFARHLNKAMTELRDTEGLIIDVRGNGGGSRSPLRALLPYFMRPDDPPRIVNAAKYRLRPGDEPGEPEGYLDNRWLCPLTASNWSAAERSAIKRFSATFKPQWQPPADEFSAWHYMVIAAEADRTGPCYDKPVAVLLDEGCFSATDIFLGGFKGCRNITLIGRSSSGGSGRSQPVTLQHSNLEIRLSSMASFQPDGRLYDGNGIEPDFVVKPTLADLMGNTDTTLDAAIKHIRR